MRARAGGAAGPAPEPGDAAVVASDGCAQYLIAGHRPEAFSLRTRARTGRAPTPVDATVTRERRAIRLLATHDFCADIGCADVLARRAPRPVPTRFAGDAYARVLPADDGARAVAERARARTHRAEPTGLATRARECGARSLLTNDRAGAIALATIILALSAPQAVDTTVVASEGDAARALASDDAFAANIDAGLFAQRPPAPVVTRFAGRERTRRLVADEAVGADIGLAGFVT